MLLIGYMRVNNSARMLKRYMERVCNPVEPNFLKGNMQLLVWNFPLKGIWKTPA